MSKLKERLTETKDMTKYDWTELNNSILEIGNGIWHIKEFFEEVNEVKGLKHLKKFQKEWTAIEKILDFHT
jgi:hypothetical protein